MALLHEVSDDRLKVLMAAVAKAHRDAHLGVLLKRKDSVRKLGRAEIAEGHLVEEWMERENRKIFELEETLGDIA